MYLEKYGLSMEIPTGWYSRAFDHTGDVDSDNRPTIHIASFSLPVSDVDSGSDVIGAMAPTDTFVSLVEYTPDCYLPEVAISPLDPSTIGLNLTSGAFGETMGVPTLVQDDFDGACLIGGPPPASAVGGQVAFTAAGRPFVVYVVIGDSATLGPSIDQVNRMLKSMVVSPVFNCHVQLQVTFSPGLIFSPTISFIGQPYGPEGSCAGTGTGTCVVGRADGGATETVAATYTFSGDYKGFRCIDPLVISHGALSVTLSDGRSIAVSIAPFNINPARSADVETLYPIDDPIGLPAIITLNGGTCDSIQSVSIVGTIVAREGAASPTTVAPVG